VNCGLFCAQMMGVLFILFWLSPQLAPILAILMISISAIVAIYKRTTVVVFKAYGRAQAQIIECANETFSAIRTVRNDFPTADAVVSCQTLLLLLPMRLSFQGGYM
jgi:ABC-type bacteriocin/lantibiotic exporter with double-glycine peptidase domain